MELKDPTRNETINLIEKCKNQGRRDPSRVHENDRQQLIQEFHKLISVSF